MRKFILAVVALAGAEGRAFPHASEVARFTPERIEREVRCGYRAPSLSRFARRVASGRLDLSRWEDPARPAAEIREEILEERGFGPYAAEGILRIPIRSPSRPRDVARPDARLARRGRTNLTFRRRAAACAPQTTMSRLLDPIPPRTRPAELRSGPPARSFPLTPDSRSLFC